MPRLPRAAEPIDWQRVLGLFVLIGGACLWMGEAMRAMASS